MSAARRNALTTTSTLIILSGLFVAMIFSLSAPDAISAFARPAPVVAVALAFAVMIEAQAGLRNLIRVDLFMLGVLYLLTFLEFLFPQEVLMRPVTVEAAYTAVAATLVGFAGITVGRHAFPAQRPLAQLVNFSVSPRVTILLLLACAFFGYLYMLLAVRFDILEMIYQMQRPRFTQPWTRGRLGGLSTLLNEVGLLKFLIPPLVGAVFAQARRYNFISKLTAAALLAFVLFEGFASGTRNVFLTHLITFTATYMMLTPRLTFMKGAAIGTIVLVVAAAAIQLMLSIRVVGVSGLEIDSAASAPVFVDMNLVNIAGLIEAFPRYIPYLGFEIPWTAIIRPIPRALWPGKPEGMSTSIEEVFGVTGMTLAATFVGELWMAGGFIAVGFTALALGAAAAWWNRIGAEADDSLRLILFASAFFPAGICMRSFLSAAPPLLPVIGFWFVLRTLRAFKSSRPRRPPPRRVTANQLKR